MTYSIAFHSYKGGTGKTTLASNLSAFLAKKGYKVCLLDLDIYAPSLQTYFEITPKKWLNDCLYNNANFDNVLTDISYLTSEKDRKEKSPSDGKLLVGLCDFKKDDFIKLESSSMDFRKQLFHKLIIFREHIIKTYDLDYIILDTSPGVRYWSLNALALADIFFLTLKMGDIDIEGTKKMVNEIYNSFITYGTKSFLIWNKVAGYCLPSTFEKANGDKNYLKLNENTINNVDDPINKNRSLNFLKDENKPRQGQLPDQYDRNEVVNTEDELSTIIGMKVISTIPCYCDIQFSKKEFLTAIEYLHPFSERIELLANLMQQELQGNEIE